jgi:flagellar motor switch/type III secretory pathway protein FliN
VEHERTRSSPSELEVPISVTIAQAEFSLDTILGWRPGEMIEFPQCTDAPVELKLGERTVGLGRVVRRAGVLGVRIDRVSPPRRP